MRSKIYVAVEGLFEKSDSIGYDAVYQFRVLRQLFPHGEADVRIFASKYDAELYPDLPIEDAAVLFEELRHSNGVTLIYHFCDGWPALEQYLDDFNGRLVVRWHNNTPPWFFGSFARNSFQRTLRGFRTIQSLARRNGCEFWCNSTFTAQQLYWLGAVRVPSRVVYPASRYLTKADNITPSKGNSIWPGFAEREVAPQTVRLLFVSRITAHKGHCHIPIVAAYLQKLINRPVEVFFPGRVDTSSTAYTDGLKAVAESLDVKVNLIGEISESDLEDHYRQSSVFICLSQHEGFGLPIFEAMRMGVPVVAWANTAVGELLNAHPTAFSEFDHRRFAAAVAAIVESSDISVALDKWQREHLLPCYTSSVVTAQLKSALLNEKHEARRPDPASIHQKFPFSGELKHRVQDYYTKALLIPNPDVDFLAVLEIPQNYVTLYDLDSYEALLEEAAAIPLLPKSKAGEASSEDISGTGGLLLRPSRFTIPTGTREPREGKDKDSVLIPLHSEGETAHIVYGPYLRLATGQYRVEFSVSLVENMGAPSAGRVILDVAAGGEPRGGRHILADEFLIASHFAFEFRHYDANLPIEFRVQARGFSSGQLKFSGVSVWRVSLEETTLAELPKYRRSYQFAHQGGNNTKDRLSISSTSSLIGRLRHFWDRRRANIAARSAVHAADEARDKHDWEAAMRNYRKALDENPSNFHVWVQYGHSLKESDALVRAEYAYRQALRLAPHNADCLLQIGHLLKLQGRRSEACAAYLAAFEHDPKLDDAKREFMEILGI